MGIEIRFGDHVITVMGELRPPDEFGESMLIVKPRVALPNGLVISFKEKA